MATLDSLVLDLGTLDAIVDVADLREREFLLNYNQSIIRDVDTANAAYAAEGDRLRKLNEAVLAASRRSRSPRNDTTAV